ncbi:hypothetical protein DXU07_46135 [Bradyrhizobium elkanii]
MEASDESIIRVTVVRTAEELVPATTMNFPRRLDMDGVLKLGKSLEALPQADEYIFDFSHFGHAEPFGMLFAAAIIQEFLARRGARVAAQNLQGCGYQSHMGFFQAIGIEHGNKPGDAAGGENYLPMTSMNVAALRRKADLQGVQLGDVIQRDAERMAERLARTDEGDIFDALSYSLREIMRNVAEHSEAPDVRFCLQHWPTKARVHLALLDCGIGVRRSLERNPHLRIETDLAALRLALRPGISGKMYEGVARDENNRWENSGYGLYLTSRLAAHFGNFWFFSGSSALAMSADRERTEACPFAGTAIRISLDTRKIKGTKGLVAKFVAEGETRAAATPGTSKSASKGSQVG